MASTQDRLPYQLRAQRLFLLQAVKVEQPKEEEGRGRRKDGGS